jgi:ATP-dependent RNA helicase DDX55/SPB4
MGKSGVAIVFIEPHEDEFVHLLGTKKVPVQEIKPAEITEDVLGEVKKEILKDRDLLDKSEAAFTSFLRAYKEHQCSFIFKFTNLNLDACAKGYSLMRHPKGVFRNFTLKFTFEPEDIDFEQIVYKDSKREEARQQRILNPKAKKVKVKIDREQGVFERKQEIRTLPTKKRRKRAMDAMEYDNITNEMKMLKKVKTGEITEKEYEVITGEIDFTSGSMKQPEKKKRFKKKKKVSRGHE